MKRLLKIAILACCLTAVARSTFSQPTFSQKYGTEADLKRLYYLNTQYIQSWIRSDTATYDSLLWADDFVHQNSGDGLLYPKNELMPVFGAPRFGKIEYFFPENVTIQFIADDAAMIFARTPLRVSGYPTEFSSQYNDVYVKRDGRWVCVSANVVPIAQPEKLPEAITKLPEPVELVSYHEGTPEDKNILKELNRKYARAFLTGKFELVENILADDFTMIASNGSLYRKPELGTRMEEWAKRNAMDNYKIENVAIRFVASNVAMIHAAAIITNTENKSSGLQYNDIYVKRDGRWLCVSGNSTPIRN